MDNYEEIFFNDFVIYLEQFQTIFQLFSINLIINKSIEIHNTNLYVKKQKLIYILKLHG